MVPKGGLEPPRVAPHAPQTCASANSATSAPAKSKYAADARGLSIQPASHEVRTPLARVVSAPATDDPPHARLPQPRIEGVTNAFSEEIVREHRDQDRQAGIQRHPPRDLDGVLAVVQDIAPGRVRGLDAQPQERQPRLRQDGR